MVAQKCHECVDSNILGISKVVRMKDIVNDTRRFVPLFSADVLPDEPVQ